MKNKKEIIMFKKTLIALTVVGMSSTALGATLSDDAVHTTGVTATTPSLQQVATLDAYTITPPILHLDANYSAGDTITVTYSGAALDEDYTHPTANLTIGTTTGAACTPANPVSRSRLSNKNRQQRQVLKFRSRSDQHTAKETC